MKCIALYVTLSFLTIGAIIAMISLTTGYAFSNKLMSDFNATVENNWHDAVDESTVLQVISNSSTKIPGTRPALMNSTIGSDANNETHDSSTQIPGTRPALMNSTIESDANNETHDSSTQIPGIRQVLMNSTIGSGASNGAEYSNVFGKNAAYLMLIGGGASKDPNAKTFPKIGGTHLYRITDRQINYAGPGAQLPRPWTTMGSATVGRLVYVAGGIYDYYNKD